jgi:UDP-N-acetylglucosamine--N-acetylmuramyl-(pentapeptide) pyrophosphoryl-undecaprenol N-acetylglucosamine transferase
VGGGTAGHVYPALAIAEAYQRACEYVDLLFIGTAVGFEGRLVPASGHRLQMIQGTPLVGTGLGGKLRALSTLSVGITQARRLLQAHDAQLVVGLGGYASVGVLLAARSLGLRTVIHEANLVPGLANRLLGRLAHRVYLGFEAAGWAFAPDRTVITGNPVRPEIVASSMAIRRAPCPYTRPVHILVTGGSQGSPFLNQSAPALLSQVAALGIALHIRHQSGDADPQPVHTAYAQAGLTASVTSYIPDMAQAYQWADFVIARSGAGTIAELAVCGLPALLVPLPNSANNHQTVSATAYAQAGAGWWVQEHAWHTPTLATRLGALLNNASAWIAMSTRARSLATPHAAEALVADCEALMVS